MAGERAKVVAFAAKMLKKNPNVSMAEIQKAAPKGMNIYPLIIGLARKEAGIASPTRKKTTRKATKRKSSKRVGRPRGSKKKVSRKKRAGRRGPGGPRKSTGSSVDLAGLARHMKDLERDVAQLRGVLRRIADLAESV